MSKKRTVKRVKKGINQQRTKRECDELLLHMLFEEYVLLEDMFENMIRKELWKQYFKK